jgi:Protein of unknown function (DUF2889)
MPQTDAQDDLPGYRRRIVVEARAGAVLAMLEDDIHCLGVILRHDGQMVTAVEPQFDRLPWTTCPGAADKLQETFAGQRLVDVTARREKKQNCTHFHDLAVLAAAHALEPGRLTFDIAASDPVDGLRILELRRNDALLYRWIERQGILTEPAELAGKTLADLRDWIAGLSEPAKEAARLLQWGARVAHGRTLPLEAQSDASKLPLNCYTFQPERAVHAKRIGERRDFSRTSQVPLGEFGETMLALL